MVEFRREGLGLGGVEPWRHSFDQRLLLADGQVQRRVLLIARVIAAGAADKAFIEDDMNRFRDAVINDLMPYFQDYFLTHDMLDVAAIKAKLVKHAKAVYGDHMKDVLLINAFDQPSNRIQDR